VAARPATRCSAEKQTEQKRNKRPAVMERLEPILLSKVDSERRRVAGHVRTVDVKKRQPSYGIDETGRPRESDGEPGFRKSGQGIGWAALG